MTILSDMRNLNFLIWIEMFKQFAYIFPLNNICIVGLGMDFLSYLTFFFLVFVSPSHIPMIWIKYYYHLDKQSRGHLFPAYASRK